MSKQMVFENYLDALTAVAKQGDAREESFYSALASLVHKFAGDNVQVTVQPLPTEGGNPDIRVWNGKDRIVGYIEAKAPGKSLGDAEHSEQLKRYLDTFPNLILTNFLEFRLYRNGKQICAMRLGREVALQIGEKPALERPDELRDLLDEFLRFALPATPNAEALAIELAKRTRMLRAVIAAQLSHEEKGRGPKISLAGFFEAFRTHLIASLTPVEFADLFAQTITYGLFAARTRADNDFSRATAFNNIPTTIGILRDLFRYISLEEPPEQLAWCVDDIVAILAAANVSKILDDYYRAGRGEDPIIHFYETFLARYDPEKREQRGVYYTPQPVVDYIVRALHELLKTQFKRGDGLADTDITLLDPAAGTMTFAASAAKQAVEEFENTYGGGGTADFIRKHILKNFHAFELQMAPYAVGHLKMNFLLEELGCRLADDERAALYLTNTLEMEELKQSPLPGLSALAEEARLANIVKKDTEILVVLGNPPYSGHSSNRGAWIRKLIEEYKIVDGKPLGEKNPKWLQDDYVKFLRFAQWKIEQTGHGVIGMITNHGYLDNPTFRGMRRSLMQSFDDIYVLDLHGNALKRERAPDGSTDENVFDIRQGVAIAFFVRHADKRTKKCRVRHANLYGPRKQKYAWLRKHGLKNIKWQTLTPAAPSYLFVPHDGELENGYRRFPSVSDIFPDNSVGVVTARDKITIHWSAEDAWNMARNFARMDPEVAREGWELGKDTRDWKVAMAQQDLLASGPARAHVAPILYRPFDLRYTYYTGRSRGFLCMPRPEIMRHMLAGDNLALHVCRQTAAPGWQHCWIANTLSESCCVSNKTGEIAYAYPLYLYPDGDKNTLLARRDGPARKPNLAPALITALQKAYGKRSSPETIFRYIYAVLHAPAYRQKYVEQLWRDFPRVPFSANHALFTKVATLGKRLIELHLLTAPELNKPSCRFEGEGDARVAENKAQGFRYEPDKRRIHINQTQYFSPIMPEVYECRIGSYQVCQKWLKDRKTRRLSVDDIRTYCRLATAIASTLKIQQTLDKLYPAVEKDTVEFTNDTPDAKHA